MARDSGERFVDDAGQTQRPGDVVRKAAGIAWDAVRREYVATDELSQIRVPAGFTVTRINEERIPGEVRYRRRRKGQRVAEATALARVRRLGKAALVRRDKLGRWFATGEFRVRKVTRERLKKRRETYTPDHDELGVTLATESAVPMPEAEAILGRTWARLRHENELNFWARMLRERYPDIADAQSWERTRGIVEDAYRANSNRDVVPGTMHHFLQYWLAHKFRRFGVTTDAIDRIREDYPELVARKGRISRERGATRRSLLEVINGLRRPREVPA